MAKVSINKLLNKAISEMEDNIEEMEKVGNQRPELTKHKEGILRLSIAKVVDIIAKGINEGVLKADHTGLLTGKSGYGNKVNKMSLEECEKLNIQSPGDIGSINEARIKDPSNKAFKLTLKSGATLVIDKTVGFFKWSYNGVVKTVRFCYGKIVDFYNWIVAKIKGLFGKNDSIDPMQPVVC